MKIHMIRDPRKEQAEELAEELASVKAAYQKSRKKLKRKLDKTKQRMKRETDTLQETLMIADATAKMLQERIRELSIALDNASRDEDGFIVLQRRRGDQNG